MCVCMCAQELVLEVWHACTGPPGGCTAEGAGQGALCNVFLGGARAPLAPLLARPQARSCRNLLEVLRGSN